MYKWTDKKGKLILGNFLHIQAKGTRHASRCHWHNISIHGVFTNTLRTRFRLVYYFGLYMFTDTGDSPFVLFPRKRIQPRWPVPTLTEVVRGLPRICYGQSPELASSGFLRENLLRERTHGRPLFMLRHLLTDPSPRDLNLCNYTSKYRRRIND